MPHKRGPTLWVVPETRPNIKCGERGAPLLRTAMGRLRKSFRISEKVLKGGPLGE